MSEVRGAAMASQSQIGIEQSKKRFGNGDPSLKRLELSPLLSKMSDTVTGAWKLILPRRG